MTEAAAPAVRARGLRLARGAHDVIAELDLDIARGSIVGLFGSNGAGKTTLLQALAGLLALRGGELQVLGDPPSRSRRRIGYVAQVVPDGGFARVRVRDFVASAWQGQRWGLCVSPPARRERTAAVREALRAVGAGHLEERGMDTLSGGERQRVCIAQALVNPVSLLLLDEPLANLDPRAQLGLLDMVRGLRDRQQLTVVLSAHDINALLPVMDRVLYLAGGRGRLGGIDDVIDDAALSTLYGEPMAVARHDGYMFIHPARGFMAEQAAHCGHDHAGHAGHGSHDHAGQR
ncbi:MAG: ATP-binding cassette domain-containing protein [Betaproteobacteria bacterium]|nr:ATP-binding cassette domain-containing protein [Betaproteobacteria bacterium]